MQSVTDKEIGVYLGSKPYLLAIYKKEEEEKNKGIELSEDKLSMKLESQGQDITNVEEGGKTTAVALINTVQ